MDKSTDKPIQNYEKAPKDINYFEKYVLDDLDIPIKCDSDLEHICLKLYELPKREFETIVGNEDLRKVYEDLMGVWSLITKLNYVHKNHEIEKFREHIKLMNDTSSSQMKKVLVDESANKLFELNIGLVCEVFGEELKLENPKGEGSKNNPDILFKYENYLWGIACKRLSSDNPKTIWGNFKKGLKQVKNSEADRGFVLLHIRNIIDQNDIWRKETNDGESSYNCWNSESKVVRNLKCEYGKKLSKQVYNSVKKNKLLEIIEEHENCYPGFVNFFNVGTGIMIKGKPYPTNLCFLNSAPVRNCSEQIFCDVLRKINKHLRMKDLTYSNGEISYYP